MPREVRRIVRLAPGPDKVPPTRSDELWFSRRGRERLRICAVLEIPQRATATETIEESGERSSWAQQEARYPAGSAGGSSIGNGGSSAGGSGGSAIGASTGSRGGAIGGTCVGTGGSA